jgi:conjugal transfer/entry exclusion protein
MRTARQDEEHELDSRLRDRDRTIEDLNLRLRELTGALRKEQVTRELLSRQIAELQSARVPMKKGARPIRSGKKTKTAKLKSGSAKHLAPKRSARKR